MYDSVRSFMHFHQTVHCNDGTDGATYYCKLKYNNNECWCCYGENMSSCMQVRWKASNNWARLLFSSSK